MGVSSANDVAKTLTPDSLATSPDAFPITPATTFTASAGYTVNGVRAIRATTAGNVTGTTFSGASRTLAFAAGETRYVGFTSVESATAGGLEGLL